MARGKGQKTPPIVKQMDFSLTHWAGIAMVTGFLFYFPFRQGLFNGDSAPFEGSILLSNIFLFILLILVSVYLFFNKWRWDDWRARMSVAVWLLPLIYWVSSWQAVSQHNAQFTTLIYCALAVLFIGGAYLMESNVSRMWIIYSIIASGYMIVIYGFMNVFGQTYYGGAVWVQSYGNRLGSVFQYPNTYASYLSALLLACVYVMVTVKKPIWKFANALMTVPILLSIMLTLSRGALAVLPVLVFLVLIFLKPARQVSYLINALIAGAVTLAILDPVSSIADRSMRATLPDFNDGKYIHHSLWEKLPLSGWLWIIAGSLVASILVLAAHRWLDPRLEKRLRRLNEKRAAPFLLPVALIVLFLIAAVLAISSPWVRSQLPPSIGARLENLNLHQHSVLERETFYRDALTLSSDYPILGAGGGAWISLYEKYQNNPYVSKQTHSYFFQVLDEVGWVGLLIVVGFIVFVFYLYIRSYIRDPESREDHFIFYIFAMSLIIHSSIDFDMSFIYFAAIFFLCAGGMLAAYRRYPAPTKGGAKLRFVFPSAVLVLSLGLLFWVFRLYGANVNYMYATGLASEGEQSLGNLIPPIDAAIHADPANPIYSVTKINWLNQAYLKSSNEQFLQERGQLIADLERYEHVNRDLILAQYRYEKDMQQFGQAIQTLQRGIDNFKWDINFYNAAILEYYLAGDRDKSDLSQRDKDWGQALELYNEILRRENMLKGLPPEQLQGRDFSVTTDVRQTIGQIYFYQAKYREAAAILQPATEGDMSDQEIRILTRYYLASLQLIGENDESLQIKLFDSDPNERRNLSELVESSKSS
ncbi:O-antigen ligase family protein [Cohnella zeiphila]|uniref:O-antigen ligase family protein n=1 Tax=Cohnella zeiphila TaxID=2761120 RepID=A0A7X0SLV3_9BACL|nr:O-antigen ligase family protein [Cohnella zeiphila]MBB6732274.1 O-antigen ligase family protein [Cohnella zeiphila]